MKTTTKRASKTPLEEKCLAKGVRLSYVRKILLELLAQAATHMTTEQIYRQTLTIDVSIHLSSLYNNLRVLADAGVIERHKFQSSQIHYAAPSSEASGLLIDIDSGKIISLNNANLDKLKTEILKEYGYNNKDCRIEFYSRALATIE